MIYCQCIALQQMRILPGRVVCLSLEGNWISPRLQLWGVTGRVKIPRWQFPEVLLSSPAGPSIRDESVILGAALQSFPPRVLQASVGMGPEQFLMQRLEADQSEVLLPDLGKLSVSISPETLSGQVPYDKAAARIATYRLTGSRSFGDPLAWALRKVKVTIHTFTKNEDVTGRTIGQGHLSTYSCPDIACRGPLWALLTPPQSPCVGAELEIFILHIPKGLKKRGHPSLCLLPQDNAQRLAFVPFV